MALTDLPDKADNLRPADSPWRRAWFHVIFGHETPAGKLFDVILLIVIGLSIIAVMLESVEGVHGAFRRSLVYAEWCFTLLFTVEYTVRLAVVRRPMRYALSFYGIVDLLAILPTYLSLLFPGAQGLATVRALRLLRMFRIFKLVRFMGEAAALKHVLWQSRAKITVFLMAVVIVTTIVGALMYLVEAPTNPAFHNIPISIYWAIVTMTTVGYGDIVPHTPLGKALSAVLIIFGYSLIVVPTGIVTAEWNAQSTRVTAETRCPACGQGDHSPDAGFCKHCGTRLI